MKILITGFDPFGGEEINPAFEAVKKLPDAVEGHPIVKLEIPTVFNKSAEILKKAIKEHEPGIVICVGQAGGRFGITPERIAINLDDAAIPDNEGNQPIDTWIFPDGPAAYFTSLPIKAMVKNIREKGIPASLSHTAGTYVCNHVMYHLLHTLSTSIPHIKGGFIHVPYITPQILGKPNTPSLTLEQIRDGLLVSIQTAIEVDEDVNSVEGTIS